MRGKVQEYAQQSTGLRITPAYAGKRERFDLFNAGMWDHPRLCGEKKMGCCIWITVSGSPPPMRGKESVMTGNLPESRITPAYAGKSVGQQRCKFVC